MDFIFFRKILDLQTCPAGKMYAFDGGTGGTDCAVKNSQILQLDEKIKENGPKKNQQNKSLLSLSIPLNPEIMYPSLET